MSKERQGALSTGLVLIGIGVIFLLPGRPFWPWILVVVALGGLPGVLANAGGWWAWQSTFWLIGLAVLFATGHFCPGILVLSGLSMLLSGVTRQQAVRAPESAGDAQPGGWGPGLRGPGDVHGPVPEDEPLDVEAPIFEDSMEPGSKARLGTGPTPRDTQPL